MKMDKPIGAVLMYIRAVVSANPNRLLAVFLIALLDRAADGRHWTGTEALEIPQEPDRKTAVLA